MHKYIEIQKVRERDVKIDDDLVLKSNVNAFLEGDVISVTEKIDGAQSCIKYDAESKKLKCFSSKSELDEKHDLRGFYDFVQNLDKTPFEKYPDYEFFGEWLVPHTVKYNSDNYNKWYLFSAYDTVNNKWLPQSFIKGFAMKYQFNYPHELYYGPFRGWDHVYSLANNPSYGSIQEGIVIKNQTALEASRGPHILKYVNPSFTEIKINNHMRKMSDHNHLSEKKELQPYADMIVTPARVSKCIHKMVDEGLLKEEITPVDMGVISSHLPDMVYQDCIKEEKDVVDKMGKFARNVIFRTSILRAKEFLHIS